MFKCCPFVSNVGLYLTATLEQPMYVIITCIDVIADLENSAIIYQHAKC